VRIEISPAATEAFLNAQAEYREINPQLARRFAAEMRRVWRQLRRFPHSAPSVGELRRIVLHGFHFSVLYRVDEDVIRVAMIRHQKQEPDYWADDSDAPEAG
jgi:plasmid stabilization system protein ParE